jgi:hypothetical protein
MTSIGRQQISQSVVKRCEGWLVSMTTSNSCPQNGHWMDSDSCTAFPAHDGKAGGSGVDNVIRCCINVN